MCPSSGQPRRGSAGGGAAIAGAVAETAARARTRRIDGTLASIRPFRPPGQKPSDRDTTREVEAPAPVLARASEAAVGSGPPVHTEAPEGLLARLATDPAHGLTEAEAAKRLERDGPNELPKPKGKSAIVQVLQQFGNPIVLT